MQHNSLGNPNIPPAFDNVYCLAWDWNTAAHRGHDDLASVFFGLLWSEEATPLQLAHPVGLPDTASDRIVRCQVRQASRRSLSDTGSDSIVWSHVEHFCSTGLFGTASDNSVRCRCRTTSVRWFSTHRMEVAQNTWATSRWSNNWSDELRTHRTVVARHGIEHVVRFHVEETSRTTLFDTGSDRIIQSHVGQDGRTGFSNIALDNAVQCRVGQAHRMVFVAMLRTWAYISQAALVIVTPRELLRLPKNCLRSYTTRHAGWSPVFLGRHPLYT
jgi:hypothetical protein